MDAVSTGPATVLQHVRAGKIRVLAHWGATKLETMPDVPSLKQAGYNAEYAQWSGLFVPATRTYRAQTTAVRELKKDGRLFEALVAAARDSGAAIFAYGAFAMAVLNFLIVAWAVFLLVKGVNRLQRAAMRKEEAKETPPAGPTQEELLAQIRDLLADRASPA